MTRNGSRTGSNSIGNGFPPLLIIVLEGKGGVGKSVNADTANYILTSMGCVTLTAESDTTNSIMSSIHDNVVFVNVTRPGWHTIIGKHLQRMGQPGGAGAVIFDTGARDDVHVREKLPYFVQAMEAVGGHVLVIRPITTSGSAQTNAIDFAKTTTGFGIGPCAASAHLPSQGVAVIGPVGEKDVSRFDRVQHVDGRTPVMSLAFGQLQADRAAFSIDEGMDLGGQAAARATHATGSLVFFWPLAACW